MRPSPTVCQECWHEEAEWWVRTSHLYLHSDVNIWRRHCGACHAKWRREQLSWEVLDVCTHAEYQLVKLKEEL